MDDSVPDPIAQFFPDNPSIDLYTVLNVASTASAAEIKSAYRKLALIHHPDKHASSSDESKRAAATTRFQQVGFAYAVLGDEKRRKKYDLTGSAAEGLGEEWEGRDQDGWEIYFGELFDRVTRGRLDELKKEYQGSEEELTDLKSAYLSTDGSIDSILTHIPHSNYTDESRFTALLNELINKGELPSLPEWKKGVKDTKARAARKKKGEKEAKEAEGMAKELGVWDEFYGSGKEGKRRAKGGRAQEANADGEEEEDGEAALKAIIQSRQKKLGSFLDNLEAKYGGGEGKSGKDKKRAGASGSEPSHEDIDEEEFQRIQKKLKADSNSSTTGKKGGTKRRSSKRTK